MIAIRPAQGRPTQYEYVRAHSLPLQPACAVGIETRDAKGGTGQHKAHVEVSVKARVFLSTATLIVLKNLRS